MTYTCILFQITFSPLLHFSLLTLPLSLLSLDFNRKNLNMEKVILLCTDGAPAMLGCKNGLAAQWKNRYPHVITLHCIIHQSVLCAKLSGHLGEAMDNVIKIINFLRSNSSLTRRLFRAELQEADAEFEELLLHNNVRWLSKGQSLARFLSLVDDIIPFLTTLSKTQKKCCHLLQCCQMKHSWQTFNS